MDLDERIRSVNEVCELIKPSDTVRLLIDVRSITMNMSLDDQKYFGRYLAERQELASARIAVLHNPLYNPNIVINTIAYIEGYRVVGFDRLDEALAWLNGELK